MILVPSRAEMERRILIFTVRTMISPGVQSRAEMERSCSIFKELHLGQWLWYQAGQRWRGEFSYLQLTMITPGVPLQVLRGLTHYRVTTFSAHLYIFHINKFFACSLNVIHSVHSVQYCTSTVYTVYSPVAVPVPVLIYYIFYTVHPIICFLLTQPIN